MTNTIQTQQQIIDLTGLSAETINEMVYNAAIRYLKGYIPGYPQIVDELSASACFWKWWKKHWMQRDQEFIDTWNGMGETKANLVEFYNEQHDARTLVEAIYMSGMLLEETFNQMIGEVTDEQHKKREVAA